MVVLICCPLEWYLHAVGQLHSPARVYCVFQRFRILGLWSLLEYPVVLPALVSPLLATVNSSQGASSSNCGRSLVR